MMVKNIELLYDDVSSIKKSMHSERWKIISTTPTSLNELILQLEINSVTTRRNKAFCHVNEESKN